MKTKILLFLLIATSIALPALCENPFLYNGLYYYILPDADSKVSVSSHNGSISGALTIPSHVSNNNTTYEVVQIGHHAFEGCTSLTSVTIPNSVTYIGAYSFSGCTSLMSINIPNSVKSIEHYAFQNCRALTSIQIPSSVTEILSGVFKGCSGLTGDLTIHNFINTISDYAFEGCTGFTSLTIGESVYGLNKSAFEGCTGIESVIWNAKKGSDNSKDTDSPFYNNTRIKTFIFGDAVEHIPSRLCPNMSSLESLTIPSSVTSIGQDAFIGCIGLTSVTWNAKTCVLPYSNSKTPFYNMTGLKTFVIGEDVEIIPRALCYGCSGLTSVTISNSVTEIGIHSFNGCSGLTSVTIPNSVTVIGGSAFDGCSGLTSIYTKIENPQNVSYTNASSIFNNVNKTTCMLYVPKGTKEVYKITNPWKEFINIIEVDYEAMNCDVNCDGAVTSSDVTALYNYLLNDDETFIATGDVDGDGNITAADITAIYNILLGN